MHRILIFGDSIAYGRGDPDGLGWTGRLAQTFRAKGFWNDIYTLGIPGNTSTDVLARIEHECKARSAKRAEDDRNTILIAVGNNDTKILTGEKQTCVSAEDF
ncbi:MAG: GDSL-type esterase/lipase family protein, partial [Nanoarchaeota archaeon]